MSLRARRIKGQIWPPSGAKNWKLLFTNFIQLVYLKNSQSVKFWHLFYFYRCYGNKNGWQNRLNIEITILGKIKGYGDRFLLIKYQHKRIPQKTFNILSAVLMLNIC